MVPHRTMPLAVVLAAWALLALAGCGSTRPALPTFPAYPPTAAYLEEQERLREQVRAVEAYEAHQRSLNQMRAALRAEIIWQQFKAVQAQREREFAFREEIRLRNQQRHFAEVREFQSLQ